MDEARAREGHLTRDGGAALVAAAVATFVLMSLHPTSAHAGAIGGIVHGGMFVATGLMLFGFAAFARRRGPSSAVLLGLIFFAISAGGHVLAGTINGFAVPALATRPGAPPGHDIFLFAWQLNQGFAGVGVVATGIAYLAWAFELRRDHPALAATGAIAGAVPAALLITGIIRLDVHGALFAYGLHGMWALAVGTTMLRGRLKSPVG